MYEVDVDVNVGCDGFQIWNSGIYWFQKPQKKKKKTEGCIMRQWGLSNEVENSF